jgi:hypothetical protein
LKNIPAILVSGKWHQISRLNAPTLFCAYNCHHTAHNIYLILTIFLKTLLFYPDTGTVVNVPIQEKMDDDDEDEDLTCFHFGFSQES